MAEKLLASETTCVVSFVTFVYCYLFFTSFRFSRGLKEMSLPKEIQQLIPLIFLDGELW
jgi:hypothetical protein